MKITKEVLKEFAEKALEMIEKFHFEPYCISFWGYGGIDLQGDYDARVEEKIINDGFVLARMHENPKTVFCVYRKDKAEIVLTMKKEKEE